MRDFPTLGGRRLKPAHDPISEDEPTDDDLRWSDKLWNYMQEASPQETIAEQQKRGNVMAEITTLFKAWVTSVCESKGVPHELAIKAGGQVLTSGSYRLGINEKGMDIDTICVAPQPVTREDFFGSLQAILEDHDSVENLSSIPGAAVPIITFDYDGINIDLLFALLPLDAVPEDFDVNFDDVLRGCDQGTEKSLNGPRVTEMLTKVCPTGLQPQTSRPQTALLLTRLSLALDSSCPSTTHSSPSCAASACGPRSAASTPTRWASSAASTATCSSASSVSSTRRCGPPVRLQPPLGLGLGLGLAMVAGAAAHEPFRPSPPSPAARLPWQPPPGSLCQAAAARLLERFFHILKGWQFPTPIMLTPPYDAGLGAEVWDPQVGGLHPWLVGAVTVGILPVAARHGVGPQVGGNRFHVMPILTPAYPSMNSSMSVTASSLMKIQEEMAIAHEVTLARTRTRTLARTRTPTPTLALALAP